MKDNKLVKLTVLIVVAVLGAYFIVNGWYVMNTPEPVEKKSVWTYVEYPNGIIAGTLTINLTSHGAITALKPINASIDLHWFYESSPNPVFSIYFWGAYPKPEFPFNATIPPPTPKIFLLNYWDMPENHFMDTVTLVWMTSGVFGVTIEEIDDYPWNVYNLTRLIEIEPVSVSSHFRETHINEGRWWMGIGLSILLGGTIYQIAQLSVRKREYMSKTERFESVLTPNEQETLFEVEGRGFFRRLEIQAKGNPDSRMILTKDDTVCWNRSFEELNKACMYSYLKKYSLPNPVRRHGEFAVELDFTLDFLKNLRFSVENHDKNMRLDVKGTVFYKLEKS